jgi:ATP-dependent protease HslVU (ClpYQ) peptidase subunit
MTTIVICGDEIACDGRATIGDRIDTDSLCKIFPTDQGWVGCAGDQHDIFILKSYFDGEVDVLPDELDCMALRLPRKGPPKRITVSNRCLVECTVSNKYAIGSGSGYALAAMKAGATAKQAVKIATELDIRSGGKIVVKKRGDLS